jgi:hypothetical protein
MLLIWLARYCDGDTMSHFSPLAEVGGQTIRLPGEPGTQFLATWCNVEGGF